MGTGSCPHWQLTIYNNVGIWYNDINVTKIRRGYEYINKYDYSNDIINNGYISKEGAIKIAKEKTNKKRIAKVTCDLVENGTYINNEEIFKDILETASDTSNNQKKATFWSITLITGWDHLCGHEEKWYFKIDYYTGEILQWDVTM